MKSSLPSVAAIIADCVVRSSAVAAVTRKSPGSSWVTQVNSLLGISHQSVSDSKLINGRRVLFQGDLRACTYCRKLALNYAHSADSGSIGEDLNTLTDSPCSVCVLEPIEPRTPVGGRKASRNIFLEEDLTWQRCARTDRQTHTHRWFNEILNSS